MRSFITELNDVNTHCEQNIHSFENVIDMTVEGERLVGASTAQMEEIDQIVHDFVTKLED